MAYFIIIAESNLNKFCNSKISSREGYIASPGYPQYYPQLTECSWSISALEGQTVFLKVLHLHLRDASDVTPTVSDPEAFYAMNIQLMTEQVVRCDDDRLVVMEGITKKFEVCGEELSSLKSAEMDASSGLELRFKTMAFLPASGFLVYFKVQGCPTVAAKDGSYLVQRNGSAAIYACENNRVFNDTQENTRFLQCVRDHHWNDTLSPCTVLEEITTTTAAPNISVHTRVEIEKVISSSTVAATNETILASWDKKASLVEDIIIPCILVGTLIVGNIVIIIMIFVIRKRHKYNIDEFEDVRNPQATLAVEEETNAIEEEATND
ncbi:uncharacterized protein CEXT_426791 [Caerostris extrusa]|uniref:CUB domain-containing protein n=1 Tax=Caerostris extrusa TaxID=172846 RepID=A0AAV4PGD3_CAEEX|nr:uncharacterized protein CEXT_426791 [Caerostris extrusa]